MKKTVSAEQNGRPFDLKGINLGCWINIEYFMIGLAGIDWQNRKAFERQLGADIAKRFFDAFQDVFITEKDIAFIASLGLNTVRLPFNYRYFESDLEPFVYREETFRRIDRLMEWCRRHGLCVLLDFHAAPAGQNRTLPADNATGYAGLWNSRHAQDRVVALWQEMARRYGRHPALFGYDLLNEPQVNQHGEQTAEEQTEQMNRLFGRVIDAIRTVDPDHTIVIEGPVRSSGGVRLLDPALLEDPRTAVSYHYYPFAGHESSINFEAERSESDQMDQLTVFIREHIRTEHEYALRVGRPLILGEFGVSRAAGEIPRLLKIAAAQMRVSRELGHHWMLWSYKDVGRMGLVCPRPDTAWRRFVEDPQWLEVKESCLTEFHRQFDSVYIPRLGKEERNRLVFDAAYNDMRDGLRRILLDRQVERLKESGLDIARLPEAFALENCEAMAEFETLIRQNTGAI